jgi:hypothetical protein
VSNTVASSAISITEVLDCEGSKEDDAFVLAFDGVTLGAAFLQVEANFSLSNLV